MAVKERIGWIDALRGFAMICVVFGHMHITSKEEAFFYGFHLPLFFIISGMAYGLHTRKPNEQFLPLVKNKAKRFLLPYFAMQLFVVPFWWYIFKVLGDSQKSVISIIKGILYSNEMMCTAPSNAMWFLPTMFLLTLAFWLVETWADGNQKHLTIAIVLLFAIGFLSPKTDKNYYEPWHLRTVLVALLFYYLGYLFIKNLDKVKAVQDKYLKNPALYILFCFVSFAIGFVFIYLEGKISMAAATYKSVWYFLGGGIFVSLSLIFVFMKLPKLRILEFIGQNTVAYLCFHCLFLRLAEHISQNIADFVYKYPFTTGLIIIIIMLPIAWLFDKLLPEFVGKDRKKKIKTE
jgi:fucose 4-O-acetylase-like acetyltransferase